MSTRSQIRIIEKGEHVDIYHHCDGYFKGVGKELMEALDQADCLTAMQEFMFTTYEGYEPTSSFHGDIEFFYEIDFDRNVFKGYACNYPPWPSQKNFDDLRIVPEKTGIELDLKTGVVTKDGKVIANLKDFDE